MTFILKNTKLSFLLVILSLFFYSCNEDDEFMTGAEVGTPDPTDDVVESNSIMDFVNDNENYSTLAAAIEAAGLTATLEGGTYTVFAPDNDAFAGFLEENGFSGLDEVPEDFLVNLLLNHVQEGEIMSTDLSTGYINSMATRTETEVPLSLYINTDDGITINGVSTVTTADIEVDNGIIHTVDTVIGLPDVTTFVLADPRFSTLVAALTREEDYNFVDILQTADTESPAPFTVFAPVNDAFTALLEELSFSELGDIDAATLEELLSYHVVTGANVLSGDLSDEMSVETYSGESITVNVGDNITITDVNERTATVIEADVQATNGVLHAIDMVLLPTM